ncbi:MAG: hypothetical protein ABIN48_00540, partial [Ginsengibacter sp.]
KIAIQIKNIDLRIAIRLMVMIAEKYLIKYPVLNFLPAGCHNYQSAAKMCLAIKRRKMANHLQKRATISGNFIVLLQKMGTTFLMEK